MHNIEPFDRWTLYYEASEDERSPFFGREYSEFEFTNTIYNHLIHPQCDHFGSPTLFTKILYVNYDQQFAVIELLGEWNDAINNDIMYLKRNLLEELMAEGINRFAVIGENVLIFHSSDDCYYEEWYEEVGDGWITLVNFRDHVIADMQEADLNRYLIIDDDLRELNWRSFNPSTICQYLERIVQKDLPVDDGL